MNLLKTTLFIISIFMSILISCTKSADRTEPPTELKGEWHFVGFINQNGDTAKIDKFANCDCLLLSITNNSSYNYTGRIGDGSAIIKQLAKFDNNRIIMPDYVSDLPYYGPELENYITGIMYPDKWFVTNQNLKLTSKRLTDTLIFNLN